MSVVLPAPFGPSNAWTSPGAIAKSTPFRATLSPKRQNTSRMSTVRLPGSTSKQRLAVRGPCDAPETRRPEETDLGSR